MEQVPVEASMDIHMDAAMNAAKDAADAVDDLVQHLSSADAFHATPVMEDEIMETIVNESAFNDPIVEEIVEQMQQTTDVPFLLVTSTLALGVIVFLVIFLRRRWNTLAPKWMKTLAERVRQPVINAFATNEAVSTEAVLDEATSITEPKAELVAVEPESEMPCVSAMELESEVPAADPEVTPASNVLDQ